MGDSGEGLIDNEGRIQERMEELQRERERVGKPAIKNPKLLQQIQSLQLARTVMVRSLGNTAHEARRNQLNAALADLDSRIKELQEQVK